MSRQGRQEYLRPIQESSPIQEETANAIGNAAVVGSPDRQNSSSNSNINSIIPKRYIEVVHPIMNDIPDDVDKITFLELCLGTIHRSWSQGGATKMAMSTTTTTTTTMVGQQLSNQQLQQQKRSLAIAFRKLEDFVLLSTVNKSTNVWNKMLLFFCNNHRRKNNIYHKLQKLEGSLLDLKNHFRNNNANDNKWIYKHLVYLINVEIQKIETNMSNNDGTVVVDLASSVHANNNPQAIAHRHQSSQAVLISRSGVQLHF